MLLVLFSLTFCNGLPATSMKYHNVSFNQILINTLRLRWLRTCLGWRTSVLALIGATGVGSATGMIIKTRIKWWSNLITPLRVNHVQDQSGLCCRQIPTWSRRQSQRILELNWYLKVSLNKAFITLTESVFPTHDKHKQFVKLLGLLSHRNY